VCGSFGLAAHHFYDIHFAFLEYCWVRHALILIRFFDIYAQRNGKSNIECNIVPVCWDKWQSYRTIHHPALIHRSILCKVVLDEIPKTSRSTQTFLALDEWLKESAEINGDKSLEDVIELFHNDLLANATYYFGVAKELEANDKMFLAKKYRLVGQLYEGLLRSH